MSSPIVATWRNDDGSYGAEVLAGDGERIHGAGDSMWKALADAQFKRRLANQERRTLAALAGLEAAREVDGTPPAKGKGW